MANTVNSLNYANTFADWLVATDALILENNTIGKGDYHKDSGVLYLDNTTGNSLETKGNVFIQQALLVQGTSSSATIDNNLTVKYGQVYFQNTTLGLTNAGQANINGLLVAQGPGTGLWVANNASVDGNTVIRFNTTTNRVQANTSVNTGVASIASSTWTNYLQANTQLVTDTAQANTLLLTNFIQANSQVNTAYASISNSLYTKNLQANNSTNTEVSFANVAYSQYLTANVLLSAPRANVSSYLYGESVAANTLTVNTQLSVNGAFVLSGDTIYNSNKFTINAGSTVGLNSEFIVNRGTSGANAAIKFNEYGASSYWDLSRGGSYYRILTDEYRIDSVSNTSTISWATANSVWTAAQWASSAGSYANSAFDKANSGYAVANSASIYANGAFTQANASFARANTSANVFVGTTGSVAHSSGVISFSGNNGMTVVATSANNLAIGTPQDLRTTASPTFASLTLTAPLAIAQGGTGATTATQAITNILPTGTTAGYVLTTGGPGNFYWAAAGSGGSGALPGTTISSSRLSYTANGAAGYTGNTFVIPQASATNQVRAYIDGVRQFESEYSLNLNANTITFSTGPSNGNKVLIEVDGYYVNPYYANNIAYTAPQGSIPSSANTIQLAINDLESRKAALAGAAFTGLTTALTLDANVSNTAIATTAFVKNVLNQSANTFNHNISGNAGTVSNGVYTNGTYSDPTWLTISKTKVGLGNVANSDTTIASNITSGTLDMARLGTTGAPQFGSLGIGTAASGTTGEIRATNNITAYYSSDIRFKENVNDIQNALDSVVKIGGKTFDWKDDYLQQHGGEDDYFLRKKDFGVIAQDVESVFPLAVRTRQDGTLAVDYEKLCALAFAAIKELKAEVEELKGQIK